MEIKQLTSAVSVTPQIMPADLQAVHDAGFRSLICNRPDGEGADQPDFADVAAAARALGIMAVYQPIVSGRMSESDATAFGKSLEELPGPTLAYCRSGTRSATLWSLAMAPRMPAAEIAKTAAAAGYDVTGALAAFGHSQ
ncbi:TIGR01244 family sulfur transferase [Yoonia sp.]|uniref:TIGR01244 family sulfur transferase n=1 Tax=Yoonia sp. TaxID=2212373 RepID=UPI001A07C9CF|nr:TIGR01244 family sulfur transferase [Yoonia sp.]MBE0412699.1 TIGR01244 family phosphatase [Yoonia sp.]